MNRMVKDERLTTMEAAMVLGIDFKTPEGKKKWESVKLKAKRYGLKPRPATVKPNYTYEDIRIMADAMRAKPFRRVETVRTKLVELFKEQLRNDGY